MFFTNICRYFPGKAERKILLGRPRRRWDDTYMGLKEYYVVVLLRTGISGWLL
jgi:hypothetical protein